MHHLTLEWQAIGNVDKLGEQAGPPQKTLQFQVQRPQPRLWLTSARQWKGAQQRQVV